VVSAAIGKPGIFQSGSKEVSLEYEPLFEKK